MTPGLYMGTIKLQCNGIYESVILKSQLINVVSIIPDFRVL